MSVLCLCQPIPSNDVVQAITAFYGDISSIIYTSKHSRHHNRCDDLVEKWIFRVVSNVAVGVSRRNVKQLKLLGLMLHDGRHNATSLDGFKTVV